MVSNQLQLSNQEAAAQPGLSLSLVSPLSTAHLVNLSSGRCLWTCPLSNCLCPVSSVQCPLACPTFPPKIFSGQSTVHLLVHLFVSSGVQLSTVHLLVNLCPVVTACELVHCPTLLVNLSSVHQCLCPLSTCLLTCVQWCPTILWSVHCPRAFKLVSTLSD